MILITQAAATEIKRLLKDQQTPDWGVRMGVSTGGCSGMSYKMDFAEAASEGDHVMEAQGVKVFVDPKSYLYLYGTTLDYTHDLLSGGFKFDNPNARRKCSCGTSFSA